MITHERILLALRARLNALHVATTGVIALSVSAAGFARQAGSFVEDGFARGMEFTATGFAANNGVGVITNVTPLLLSARMLTVAVNPDGSQAVAHPALTTEAAAGGRTIAVRLPSLRGWENVSFTPVSGYPYLEEQYIPGPEAISNDGSSGLLRLQPMYSPRIYAPANSGISADGAYADAIRRHFAPGTAMELPDGEQLLVRGDVAPFRGQRMRSDPLGWSVIPITIPLEVITSSFPSA